MPTRKGITVELVQLQDRSRAESCGAEREAIELQILRWFNAQPSQIQAAVLGRPPESSRGQVAAIICRKMANQLAN